MTHFFFSFLLILSSLPSFLPSFRPSFLISLTEAVSPVLASIYAALLEVLYYHILASTILLYFDLFKFW